MFGRREASTSSDERDIDLSRKLEALSARVERLEACINHLPNADNIIALISTVHEVDRRLARIEGFVMGKQALAD